MKELSIEQKAKAYDEALRRARKFYNDEQTRVGLTPIDLESVFPELKESEDERVKEDLIQWFNEFPDTIWRGHYKKDVIAWLEKQENPDTLIQQAYEQGYTEGKRIERKHWIEKQNFSEDYNSIDPQFGKPIEQNPAEWSEEDEKMYRGVMAVCDVWSTANSFYPKENEDVERLKNWLKALKDRYTWKPSDEQITVLELTSKYERVFTPKQIDILIDLKEQLKKLRGE